MNNEELKLLRENNILLKQILAILQGSYSKDFLINVLANLTADNIQR